MPNKSWGTGTNGAKNKPRWLKPWEYESCYATKAGWVLEHPNKTKEVLVCVPNLDKLLGAATITEVRFAAGNTYVGNSTKTIKVSYNEPVAVNGTPTITLKTSNGTDVTATFTGLNSDSTTLTFSFTTPNENGTLFVIPQSIALNGGSIVEKNSPTTNAELEISADVANKAGTKQITEATP